MKTFRRVAGIFVTDVHADVSNLGFSNHKGPPIMSDKPKEGLDRRDFMIASIATVGVSAALAVNAGAANAQDTAAPAAPQATVYTGDVVQGKKVVSTLDINDLEPGKKHFLYFQGVQMPTGQQRYASVIVAKGAKPGKRVVLVSGVHGDEMSSVHTVHTVMNQLDPAQMSGTVMAVTDVSGPAIEAMQRRWPNSGRGPDLVDMNRVWPGNENGVSATSRHAGLLFNRFSGPTLTWRSTFTPGQQVSRSPHSILPAWTCPRSRRSWIFILSGRFSTTHLSRRPA